MDKNKKNKKKKIDKDFLEISGSTASYKVDMKDFIHKFKSTVSDLESTPYGRKRLKRAGFLKSKKK